MARADSIPEIRHGGSAVTNIIYFLSFLIGLAPLLLVRLSFEA